jgi:O-6-methylguanine DNA methyltransferase
MMSKDEHMDGIARVCVSTALGKFIVEASARGVRAVRPAVDQSPARAQADGEALSHARAAASTLQRYAAGEPARFDGPFDLDAPALHLAVWERLRAIPFGDTATYGEIANAVGKPGEARAIGQAIAANPACILTPCHRVIGADGSLRGYAWGLDLKRRLLAHEGSATPSLFAEAAR